MKSSVAEAFWLEDMALACDLGESKRLYQIQENRTFDIHQHADLVF